MWCRLLDRSQACCQQTQPTHSACTTTTRQEGTKEIGCLKAETRQQAFVKDLCSRLDALEHSSEDVAESWTVFRDTVHSSVMHSLGPVSRKHQDWFDENDKEIQGLLEEKHQKRKAYRRNTSSVSSKTVYSNICKTVQTRLRDMQDSWLNKKADEIQSFADRKDMKKFFDALKTIYGPQSSGTTLLLSADGTIPLTDKEAILKSWAEHFDGVLYRPSSISDEIINRLPQVECNPLLDELPTISETVKAIKLLSSGKARCNTCRDLQSRRSSCCRELFHIMWKKEAIPQEFKIHLFKGKGILKSVTIIEASLYCQLLGRLSIAGKILARILLNRLNEHLNSQGYYLKADSGKTEEQYTARQLQEKMQGTECGPLRDLCRTYQFESIWHS